jgi:hypothetical protein
VDEGRVMEAQVLPFPRRSRWALALEPVKKGTFRKRRWRAKQKQIAALVSPDQQARAFNSPIVIAETPAERHERNRKAIKPRLFYTPSALTYMPPPGSIARSLLYQVQGRV